MAEPKLHKDTSAWLDPLEDFREAEQGAIAGKHKPEVSGDNSGLMPNQSASLFSDEVALNDAFADTTTDPLGGVEAGELGTPKLDTLEDDILAGIESGRGALVNASLFRQYEAGLAFRKRLLAARQTKAERLQGAMAAGYESQLLAQEFPRNLLLQDPEPPQ